MKIFGVIAIQPSATEMIYDVSCLTYKPGSVTVSDSQNGRAMKALEMQTAFYRHLVTFGILAASILFLSTDAPARPRPPLPPFPEFAGPVLFHESFDWGYSAGLANDEVVIANFGTLRGSWTGMALERSGQVTPFIVAALAPDGQTNVASQTESAARFWLTPYWASPAVGGAGPGKEATLLAGGDPGEIGATFSKVLSHRDYLASCEVGNKAIRKRGKHKADEVAAE